MDDNKTQEQLNADALMKMTFDSFELQKQNAEMMQETVKLTKKQLKYSKTQTSIMLTQEELIGWNLGNMFLSQLLIKQLHTRNGVQYTLEHLNKLANDAVAIRMKEF